ncbi:hypothetical protein L1887_37356 [Cichorium endivia]|nr:hypothetical protein L1887_37356 [Cichorium endivia]
MLLHRLRVCDPWFPVIPDRKHPSDFRAWKQRCGGICWGFSFVTVVDAYALIDWLTYSDLCTRSKEAKVWRYFFGGLARSLTDDKVHKVLENLSSKLKK